GYSGAFGATARHVRGRRAGGHGGRFARRFPLPVVLSVPSGRGAGTGDRPVARSGTQIVRPDSETARAGYRYGVFSFAVPGGRYGGGAFRVSHPSAAPARERWARL